MSTLHPDEATLLRAVVGGLPERRQADLRRHIARCRPCRKERDATRRLHERLSGVGDSLAFSSDDPFERRPTWREVKAAGPPPAKMMAAALGRLASEKQRIIAALEEDAAGAARALDLDDAACRLAAAHVLEEAVAADPTGRLADFASRNAGRDLANGDAEFVVSGAQLRALAHLVAGNWRLSIGRWEEAAADFSGAWAALGAIDAPEHLCAWVEVGESLRRSYDGRPIEGRLLAERALETFERYGFRRGILRARHARAVALYTASEFREAHREFRAVLRSKDATGLDRARAVSGAAFCLAARGRFHEAAKEYSPVRRKLKGEGAMVEQYVLQGEMKVALGTAGRWHPLRDGHAAFALPEAGGAFHARALGVEIVKAVLEEGLEKAKELLGKIETDPSRGYAYLYACQLAMPKVSSDPAMYVEFARAISEATRSLPYLKDKGPAQPVCREQVLGEAGLLESNALNYIGRCAESRQVAEKARLSFVEAGEDGFALAIADYVGGSAASFEGDFPSAWKPLKKALLEFQLFGQENWIGRAEAALGTLLVHRNRNESALHVFDGALRNLHPQLDEVPYCYTLTNRASSLALLDRLDAARATYAKALGIARRLDLRVAVFTVRYGLASIELRKGQIFKALTSFEKLAADARAQGFEQRVLSAELRAAECLGRLGKREEMLTRVRVLRRELPDAAVSSDAAIRELFAQADEADVSSELVAHVVDYLEARDRGVRFSYRPFRLVANGS
jgi:tetratricopeptide (TPR) repeat protein